MLCGTESGSLPRADALRLPGSVVNRCGGAGPWQTRRSPPCVDIPIAGSLLSSAMVRSHRQSPTAKAKSTASRPRTLTATSRSSVRQRRRRDVAALFLADEGSAAGRQQVRGQAGRRKRREIGTRRRRRYGAHDRLLGRTEEEGGHLTNLAGTISCTAPGQAARGRSLFAEPACSGSLAMSD